MDGADGSARFACQITNLHETAAVGDLILAWRLSHIGGAFRFFNLTRDRKAVWTRHQPSVLRMGSSSYVGALDSHVKARADAAGPMAEPHLTATESDLPADRVVHQ